MPQPMQKYEPGQRVCVTHQIIHRGTAWETQVTGQVVRFEQRKTGSWFAHSKAHRLWLDRLTLRKDDGEIVVCILDGQTRVSVLAEPDKPQADADTDVDSDQQAADTPPDPAQELPADAA